MVQALNWGFIWNCPTYSTHTSHLQFMCLNSRKWQNNKKNLKKCALLITFSVFVGKRADVHVHQRRNHFWLSDHSTAHELTYLRFVRINMANSNWHERIIITNLNAILRAWLRWLVLFASSLSKHCFYFHCCLFQPCETEPSLATDKAMQFSISASHLLMAECLTHSF